MTNDELFIVKLNDAHYQAMLKLSLGGEKRATVSRFLAEAKRVLAEDPEQQVRS